MANATSATSVGLGGALYDACARGASLDMVELHSAIPPKERHRVLNARDPATGLTPLHVAAQKGHKLILTVLARSPGINLFATTKQNKPGCAPSTALGLAVQAGNTDCVNLLTSAMRVDGEGIARRRLANAFEIRNEEGVIYESMNKDDNYYNESISKLLRSKECPKFIEESDRELFAAAFDNAQGSADAMLTLYRADRPVVIRSGFNGHCIYVVLYKDKMAICNCGDRMDASLMNIEAFTIDPKRVTLETFQKIKDNRSLDKSDGCAFLYTTLHKDLHAKSDEEVRELLTCMDSNPRDQTTGSCVFKSCMCALEYLMQIRVRENCMDWISFRWTATRQRVYYTFFQEALQWNILVDYQLLHPDGESDDSYDASLMRKAKHLFDREQAGWGTPRVAIPTTLLAFSRARADEDQRGLFLSALPVVAWFKLVYNQEWTASQIIRAAKLEGHAKSVEDVRRQVSENPSLSENEWTHLIDLLGRRFPDKVHEWLLASTGTLSETA